MSNNTFDAIVRPLAVATLVTASAVVATAARADAADPFNATVSYSVMHDDNLFRLAPDSPISSAYAPKDDTVSTLGVMGSFDKTVSRQQLHGDLTVQDNRYQEHGFLDNQPYSGTASWLWQLGDNFSGLLSHTNTRNISSFENTQSQAKDIYRTRTDSASVRYRIHPDWFVEGWAQNYAATHSLLQGSDIDIDETRASILNVRPSGDQIQVRAIRRQGHYPNRGSVNYRYEENQLDTIMTLVLSGASSVSGSFGYLKRRNADVPARDFSGEIGRLAWNWRPTGKLLLTTSAERSLGAREDITSTFALTDTLHVGAVWTATDKISLQLSVDHWSSYYRGASELPSWVPQRHDDGDTLTAGASYQINRNLAASAQFTSSQRHTAHRDYVIYYYGFIPYYPFASYPYRDNTFWLSLQYTFGFGLD